MPDYVPHTPEDISSMLDFLGLSSTAELFAAIPASIQLSRSLEIDAGISEADLSFELAKIGARNSSVGAPGSGLVCFAGGGAYDHEVPAVTRALAGRSEFVTAYTPYQPEVAQGVLQALFEYQSFIGRITGLPIANSSLYDGSAALVEAVNLAVAEKHCQRVVISRGVHPNWREVLATFAAGTGHQLELAELPTGATDWSSIDASSPAGAVVVGYPNYLGCLEDLAEARIFADRVGALLVVCQDPVTAGILKSPAEWGADIVIGEAQAFGTALSFGGPYLGFFACRSELVRRLPGRLVGETLDLSGRRAYVTTLRAREQDIRREKASSNVCTNETLMAVTTAIQLGWLGTVGLREVGLSSARAAHYARTVLTKIAGVELVTTAPPLREFALRLPIPANEVVEALIGEGFLAGISLAEGFEGTEYEGALLLAFTERRTRQEIDNFAAALARVVTK